MKSILVFVAIVLIGTASVSGASFPYITLNGFTNRLSDNGTNFTRNGVAIGGTGTPGTVIATGTPAVGSVLGAADTSGTNGVWSSVTVTNGALTVPDTAHIGDGSLFGGFDPGALLALDKTYSGAATSNLFQFSGLYIVHGTSPSSIGPGNYLPDAFGANIFEELSSSNTWGSVAALNLELDLQGGGATILAAYGVSAQVDNNGDNVVAWESAMDGSVWNFGSGNVTNAYGGSVTAVTGSGTFNSYGLATLIPSVGVTNKIGLFVSSGTFDRFLGAYSDAPVGVTAGLYQAGTATNYVQGVTGFGSGIASTATDAFVAISATGWTNTFGKNAVVRLDGTAVTYTVYNNAGTAQYTNAVSVGHATELLQPSGKIIVTAGSGVTGTASPF